jgi:hypothetical protein
MDVSNSIIKKLDNLTYLLELVRDEMENAITDSLLEFASGYSEKFEVSDVTEEDGGILEGFFVVLDKDKGVLIEFKDEQLVPFYSMETDDMFDIFVRIHSALLEDTVSYN